MLKSAELIYKMRPFDFRSRIFWISITTEKCITRIENALKEIYQLKGELQLELALREKLDKKIIKEISRITKIPFKPATNKFAALAAHDEIVNFSGTLNTTAVCLMKIANDIRFLGSGPRAGYGELILPSNELDRQ